MNNPIKLSVALIFYNQEKFIEEALIGIIQQKVDFEIEVVIGDDCSTDKTFQIIQKYLPHLSNVKVLEREQNIGMHKNWERVIKSCSGKYIALLEGDDFWNDELKLQKQVGQLDKDSGLSISISNASVINEIKDDKIYPEYVEKREARYTIEDLLEYNFIPTATVVFRNNLINEFPQAFFQSPYADWIIHLLNAKKGDIHYLDEKTSTYRLHVAGVYGGSEELTRVKRGIKTLECLSKIFPEYQKIFKKNIEIEKNKLRQMENSRKKSIFLKLISGIFR